ncbi:MAG: EamA family transporter [Patescibacteria group bacterium]
MAKFYLLIVIIALLDLFAEYIGKLWVLGGRSVYLWLTVLGFGAAGLFFAQSLKYEGVAIANILWIALTAILVTLMGYFVFKEQLSTTNLIGIGVVIVGVILINIR